MPIHSKKKEKEKESSQCSVPPSHNPHSACLKLLSYKGQIHQIRLE